MTFDQIRGNEGVVKALFGMVDAGKAPNAIPSGRGRRTGHGDLSRLCQVSVLSFPCQWEFLRGMPAVQQDRKADSSGCALYFPYGVIHAVGTVFKAIQGTCIE